MVNRTKALFLAGAMATAMAGCSSESSRTEHVATTAGGSASTSAPSAEVKNRDHALVRVVHAMPGAGAVNVNDDHEVFVSETTYKEVTPYKELKSESQTLKLSTASATGNQPMAQNSEILMAGKHYTAVALQDREGKPVLRVVNDNLTPPEAGKAKVRVIQASSDAGEIDIVASVTNKSLFDGVNFQTATMYTEIDPMSTALMIKSDSDDKVLLSIPSAKFDQGKIYTIILTGKTKGAPKLEATVIEDQLVAAVATPTPSSPVASR